MDIHPPNEESRVRRWRLSHGAVFFVMMCLGLVVAAFVKFGGWELTKNLGAMTRPSVTHPENAPQGDTTPKAGTIFRWQSF